VASEEVTLVARELEKPVTDTWTYYKTWEYKREKLGGSIVPKNVDVLLVHGESHNPWLAGAIPSSLLTRLALFVRLPGVHVRS
jgi:hypothetical protein